LRYQLSEEAIEKMDERKKTDVYELEFGED
jgi:hypothetical protein